MQSPGRNKKEMQTLGILINCLEFIFDSLQILLYFTMPQSTYQYSCVRVHTADLENTR